MGYLICLVVGAILYFAVSTIAMKYFKKDIDVAKTKVEKMVEDKLEDVIEHSK